MCMIMQIHEQTRTSINSHARTSRNWYMNKHASTHKKKENEMNEVNARVLAFQKTFKKHVVNEVKASVLACQKI